MIARRPKSAVRQLSRPGGLTGFLFFAPLVIVLCSIVFGPGISAQQPSRKPLRLQGHQAPVYAVAFTPSGRLAATGSFDQTVRIWDARNGKLLRTFQGHTSQILSLAVSPDGRSMVSGAQDNTIRLWDLPSKLPLATWSGHSSAVNALAVSRDGRFVVSGGEDKSVLLWRRVDGKRLQTLSGHSAGIVSAAFRADAKRWATGDAVGVIRLWTPSEEPGEEATLGRNLDAHRGRANGVAFHPNNQSLLSGGADGTLKFWQLTSALPRIIAAPTTSALSASTVSGGLQVLALSADGKTVAVAGATNGRPTILVRDVATGRLLNTLLGHTGAVKALAFRPDGRLLVSGSADGTARIWDLSD
ncbi:MAG: WD40 repeat domain-containing protein, partial [Planctomycetes bacterium]|nr:WD40 repeat domain-containing protein [Planctomycetota bacterium]